MLDRQKVRIVLVGCGGMSGVWLDAAQKNLGIEIVGLVDIIEERARKKAAEFHLEHAMIGSDVEAVLKQTSPHAVFNCTIPCSLDLILFQCIVKNGILVVPGMITTHQQLLFLK